MTNKDLLTICLKNLLRRKTRTILAIIGVVVGTCAIVVMLSIGFALSQGFQDQIEQYGNLRLIEVHDPNAWGGMPSSQNQDKLDDKSIAKIEKMEGVGAVSPIINEYLYFGLGKKVASSSVYGIKPELLTLLGLEVQEGRLLESTDQYVVLMGSFVPTSFYDPKKQLYASWDSQESVDVFSDDLIITADYNYGSPSSAIEEEVNPVKYETYKGKVVGVLSDPNYSYQSYMNFDVLQKIQKDKQRAEKSSSQRQSGYEQAWVYVEDINKVKTVNDAIQDMGFSTYSLNDWLESMQQTAAMIQGVLGGIGAISLFVAALGITNTMIMSIYERTREIGVMKVIGANLPDIRKMFLTESGMIGFFGGCVGVLFSYLTSFLMNTFLSDMMASYLGTDGGTAVSVIPLWTAGAALLFASLIGIIAGYFPARRAMRLSALESLRNE